MPAELWDTDKHIVVETNYPFENRVCYVVESGSDFTFRVRVPSFAKNVTVDGAKAEPGEIAFAIKAGEKRKIALSFDVETTTVDRPYDLKTVECGSLVFSVPIAYEKKMFEYEKDGVERKFPYCDYEYLPVSDWNYAYCSDIFVREEGKVGDVPFSSQQPPVALKTKVRKIHWGLEDGYEMVCAKVPKSREPIAEEEEIALYPYGCAKLRMTELPKI